MSPKTNYKTKLLLPAIIFFAFFALVSSAQAATYYIKNGGNNNSTCTSDATACATWQGVDDKNPAAGSDVYFKCGGTYVNTAASYVNWNGTATVSATIYSLASNGSNTLVTTTAAHGFSTGDSITIEGTRDYDGTYTISGASGSSFVITHAYIAGDGPGKGGLLGFAHKNLNRVVVGAYFMDGGVETVGVSGNRPVLDGSYLVGGGGDANYYNRGAFEIWDYDYITIKNLEIKNQWRRGVSLSYANYITVDNCRINEILAAGIVLAKNEYGAIFTNNELFHCARDKPEGEPDHPGELPAYTDWSAGFGSSFNTSFYIFRNNSVHNNYGEAYIHDHGSSNALIEYNTFYEGYNGNGPYLCDSRNATVRYNLIYGGTDPAFFRGGMPNNGIIIAGEEHHSSLDYLGHYDIYGNFVANCRKGIEIWGGAPWAEGYVNAPRIDINIYNNTIVGSRQYDIDVNYWLNGVNIKNNIFYNTTGAPKLHYDVNHSGYPSANIVFDYNLWESQPSVSAMRGIYDPSYGAPVLAKMTGWTATVAGSLSVSDFKKQTNSRGIDNGAPLGLHDYWGRSLNDIGADDYPAGGNDTSAPGVPGGLQVR